MNSLSQPLAAARTHRRSLCEPSPPSLEVRPLEYWLQHHPPGWLSAISAADVDPVCIAAEIQLQAIAFVRWLRLPARERCDAYCLQILSATLFSRYRDTSDRVQPRDVGLLDLPWPAESLEIRRRVSDLQRLLARPLAVFKATRAAVAADDYPTGAERSLATAALEACLDDLERSAAGLAAALNRFAASTNHGMRNQIHAAGSVD